MQNYSAAGILPISIYQGHIYFLLGRENAGHNAATWCGFGGKRDKYENSRETAQREFMEESISSILSYADLWRNWSKYLLCSYNVTRYVDTYEKKSTYVEYVILIPYQPDLTRIFQQTRKLYLKQQNNAKYADVLEKDSIDYYSLSDIVNGKIKLRPCFAIALRQKITIIKRALERQYN